MDSHFRKVCLLCVLTFSAWSILTFSRIASRIEVLSHETYSKSKTEPINTVGPRIAILSSFIPSNMWSDNVTTKMKPLFDHMINRVCYCHLWNYDCIFNQTQELTLNYTNFNREKSKSAFSELDSSSIDRFWLKFGCWERISHLQAALPHYDWILYGDLDFIIKDITKPIESFLNEFTLYGKDAHVLLPADDNGDYIKAFSSFALLVRNSPFGMKLLENWKHFALGICPNGNFESETTTYDWKHSDQPGLWYALMKTHMDFHPNTVLPPSIVQCNNETGFIDDSLTGPWLDFDDYFRKNGLNAGNYGKMLKRVRQDQDIIFGKSKNESRTGLGVDHNWFFGDSNDGKDIWKHAFALHHNKPSDVWEEDMQLDLAMCKNNLGCFAMSDENVVSVGCENN